MAKAKDLGMCDYIDYYGELLTDKQQHFIKMYYNEDLSLSEIAENEGLTRQGARDAIMRAESSLLSMEKQLSLVQKHRDLSKTINEIRNACLEIAEYNRRYSGSKIISERAKAIYEMAGDLD